MSLAAADLNGDGKLDLAVGFIRKVSRFCTEMATVRFLPPGNCSQFGRPSSVAVGDINGDGIPDMFLNDGACPDWQWETVHFSCKRLDLPGLCRSADRGRLQWRRQIGRGEWAFFRPEPAATEGAAIFFNLSQSLRAHECGFRRRFLVWAYGAPFNRVRVRQAPGLEHGFRYAANASHQPGRHFRERGRISWEL